ncbi:MAG: UDP-4-amino-4,6-dideoxy-N-acetyl-beta-L-altrosamine transaminase [Candidatus Omnitrophota bacterium]|jgi:UDP-4-amino-4,6-dideoxy-N-acetyl-beta-L-altrosamine transaminase
MKYTPYSRQTIDKKDIKAVLGVLKSDWITQGPKIKEFEDALCEYAGVKYAVVVSSGTAALHLSMLAMNLSKGDRAITSPITFSASANCVLYAGAVPQFIDINDKTYHLDIEKLKTFFKKISQRKKVKVVIPVHFMGTVIDIEEIKKYCDRYGIRIVEDAAHALGARYKSRDEWFRVGSCKHSDIAIFSFHPIKHITTGEGGAILTNNRKIYERALRLRHHGIIKNKKHKFWFYDIPEIGFNYRITDFQSALGISQLKKLDRVVKIKKFLADNYNTHFSSLKMVRLPYSRPATYPAYHLYVIRVGKNKRNALYNYLRKNNILTQVNYVPVHLLSYYRNKFGYKAGDFPVAERYYDECLSLPLYAGLSRNQQMRVIDSVRGFLEND